MGGSGGPCPRRAAGLRYLVMLALSVVGAAGSERDVGSQNSPDRVNQNVAGRQSRRALRWGGGNGAVAGNVLDPAEDYFPPGLWEKPAKEGEYLQELKLCGVSKYEVGAGGYKWLDCPADDTCQKCISAPNQRNSQDMMAACMDPQKRQARAQLIQSTLGPARLFKGAVFIMAVNMQYAALMVNWLCLRRVRHLGDALRDTLVITQDMEAYKLMTEVGFRAVFHPVTHFGEEVSSRGHAHAIVQSLLFCALHQTSSLGYDVILHDVDMVWKRDPRDALVYNSAWSKVDVMGANAPRMDAHGPLNSGFIYFRSNRKTRAYLRVMVACTPIMYWLGSDQVIYNSLLRHWRFRQLHFHVVPRSAIVDLHTTTGTDGTMKSLVNNQTSILHVVSNKVAHKVHRLQISGYWFLKPECLMPSKGTDRELDLKACRDVDNMCVEAN